MNDPTSTYAGHIVQSKFPHMRSSYSCPWECNRRSNVSSRRDEPVDPGGHALKKIFHKAGPRQYVMLAGVDDELRRHSQGSQRLIHLFATADRDVEVQVATDE